MGYQETTINGFQVSIFNTYDGDTFHIWKDGQEVCRQRVNKGEGYQRAAEKVAQLAPKAEIIERLRKAIESDHVKSVMVGFEYEADGVRYYTAITRHSNILHKYTVRAWDEWEGGELQVRAKCNCPDGARELICRHVMKIGEFDANRMGREVYPVQLASYRAYQHFEKRAA